MLAYVFWHRPRADVLRADYDAALARFHHTLDVRSAAFWLPNAPWAGERPLYEDWYLLENAAGLEPLNAAAVSGARKEPHDAAARHAEWGAAGLYTLRLGEEQLGKARHAIWFSKPRDVTYGSLIDRLGPLCEITPATLWQRFMVLGPTPEFCLQSARAVDLMDLVADAHSLGLELLLSR